MKTKEPNFRSCIEAYDYAFNNDCRLNSRNERLISKNSEYSYYYALEILKGRFELGENAISKDSEYSLFYAKEALGERFRLGEKAIIEDTVWFEIYIEDIFHYLIPLDFLDLCPIDLLDYLIKCYSADIKNMDDVIKSLFKKKILNS